MRPWRWVVIIACLVVPAAVAVGAALLLSDSPATRLDVTWGGSEGHPPCVYQAATRNVEAEIVVDYESLRHDTVHVTVTAYADENTSDLVGTGAASVAVHDTMTTTLDVTIPVLRPPHVDEDGVAACRLAWTTDNGQSSAAR
jgi:hypothetical protein